MCRSIICFKFILNQLIERHAVVCCLPLQCRRKTWPINPCFIFITNLGLFRLLGFAWVCCFCSSRKANKFKLNANTVIHTRVALTVFFHLRWHWFKIKISLREVKLGYHMCPLKKSGAESEEVLGSKNFSVFTNQVLRFPCRVTLRHSELRERNFLLYRTSNLFSLGRVPFSFIAHFVEWSSLSTTRWRRQVNGVSNFAANNTAMLLWNFVYPVKINYCIVLVFKMYVDFALKLTLEDICICRNMTGYKNRK